MGITSAIALLFLVQAPLPYVDEDCAYDFACQSIATYDLIYQGDVLSDPHADLSLEECLALKERLSVQTAPFTEAECRARMGHREQS